MCQNYFIFPVSSSEMSRLRSFLSLILKFRSRINEELFLFIMPLFINVMRKTKLRPPWWTPGKEMCYYRQLESATTTN